MSADTKLAKREDRTPETTESRASVAPKVDIFENADEILLVADVPGVTKDAVQIHLEKETLSLRASQSVPEDGLLACEFRCLDFARSFIVPQAIDGDKITAELNQGVLRVHLPKSAAAKPRQIPVSSG